jgi:hypothetical protein
MTTSLAARLYAAAHQTDVGDLEMGAGDADGVAAIQAIQAILDAEPAPAFVVGRTFRLDQGVPFTLTARKDKNVINNHVDGTQTVIMAVDFERPIVYKEKD